MVDTVYTLARNEWAPWVVGIVATTVAIILIACLWADDYCRRHAHQWKREDYR